MWGRVCQFCMEFWYCSRGFVKLLEFELWWGFCEQVVWGAAANLRSFQKPAGVELEHFFWVRRGCGIHGFFGVVFLEVYCILCTIIEDSVLVSDVCKDGGGFLSS